jgi:hypothetical protein
MYSIILKDNGIEIERKHKPTFDQAQTLVEKWYGFRPELNDERETGDCESVVIVKD